MGELDRSLGNRTRRAAFLTYHAISDTGPAFLHVPPDTFERQLALLRRKGWAPGTTAGLDALNAGDRPAAPLAFLTFDDGYLDNHRDALPLLREYGFRAIVFVIPPMVDTGAPLIWPEVVDNQREHPDVMRSMTWDQVGEMVEAGTEIGAHTMTHPKLSTLHGEELRQQLVDSRKAVIDRLGRCDLFAYPFGDLAPETVRAVADAGYKYAFAQPTAGQATHTRFTIPRIPVDERDDERRFGLKLHAPVRSGLLSPSSPPRRSGQESARQVSVMLVCSPGGHLLEMRELAPAWEGETVSWVTLPGADVDDLLRGQDVTLAHGPTNRSVTKLLQQRRPRLARGPAPAADRDPLHRRRARRAVLRHRAPARDPDGLRREPRADPVALAQREDGLPPVDGVLRPVAGRDVVAAREVRREHPVIFATVGTHAQPFARFLDALSGLDDDVIVQYGHNAAPAGVKQAAAFMPLMSSTPTCAPPTSS